MEHDYEKFPELSNSQLEEFGFMSPHKQITEDFEAEVTKVHDGDTITLRSNFRDFKFPLRLLNIDAPELNEGGDIARDWLKNQIEGKKVQIIIDKNQRVGKYGRLLGKVMYRGLDMGEAMLMMNLAVEFGKKNEGKPPKLDKLFSLKQWFWANECPQSACLIQATQVTYQ